MHRFIQGLIHKITMRSKRIDVGIQYPISSRIAICKICRSILHLHVSLAEYVGCRTAEPTLILYVE